MDDAIERMAIYQRSVKENFSFLKSIDGIDKAYVCSLPLDGASGFLVPVCEAHLADDAFIGVLTETRNKNVAVYPTQFTATPVGTKAWLSSLLRDAHGRILFLVIDASGRTVGHLGLNGCLNDRFEMEIDNVVRIAGGSPGIMSAALSALIRWGRCVVGASEFSLRVFKDNDRAVSFYRRNGFEIEREIPLQKAVTADLVMYTESAGDCADAFFLRMTYRPAHRVDDVILTAGPSISARESLYAWDAARAGWNRQWSKYLSRLESSFADVVGVRYAIPCSSCTGALHIALLALGIGPGDEVIVPETTWVATANAVRYVGAVPVFADVEIDTWNIDADSAERLITPKTRAIMPVHMYGHPARMDAVTALAKRHGLRIVEDAAPAIGAQWRGQRCGSFGDFAAFSFQGAKLLVSGEGGMLVTDDESLYRKAYKIWDQGRNPAKEFWIDDEGVKYKMANVQAAVVLGQLERCDELVMMKRRIFDWYAEGLAGIPHVRLNREIEGAKSIYWMTSLFLDEACGMSREVLRAQLKAAKIDTRPVFPAISQYPIWGRTVLPQPTAERIGRQAMNLPSGVCLSRQDVVYVCRCIKDILGGLS